MTLKLTKRTVIVVTVLSLIVCAVCASVLVARAEAVEAASLKSGSRGDLVRTVQKKLKNWGYYTGSVDGIYGPKTVSAVKYFQRKNGLTADGIVGNQTARALGMSLSSSGSSSQSGYSSSDIYLLAKVVHAEARGEPYEGMVAVAAVVLNRVEHPSFPNTISGVVYQPLAFTCVADGQINYTPDQTAINAARDALNGWDPTYGALYYYNPKTATSSWIKKLDVHMTIGNHVFAR